MVTYCLDLLDEAIVFGAHEGYTRTMLIIMSIVEKHARAGLLCSKKLLKNKLQRLLVILMALTVILRQNGKYLLFSEIYREPQPA